MTFVADSAKFWNFPYALFKDVEGYQSGSWSAPRRVVAKCEVTAQDGPNRRFVVTNLAVSEAVASAVYREEYCARGDVPERCIQQLKHGLKIDRLSSHGYFANAYTMHTHLLAYLLFVLFQQANAAEPEIARADFQTVSENVFKISATVKVTTRRMLFQAPQAWPGERLFRAALNNVRTFAAQLNAALAAAAARAAAAAAALAAELAQAACISDAGAAPAIK